MIAINKSTQQKAVGYIRVSSSDQVDGFSLKFQTEAIENYCTRENLHLTKIYSEEGISGKTISKRNAFQEMYRDALADKFEVIIVWKLDRFTVHMSRIVVTRQHLYLIECREDDTAATIDLLVHHSVVLELNVTSYRAEEAKKRKIRTNKVQKSPL